MTQPVSGLLEFEELYRQIQELPEGTTGEILRAGALSTMSRPGRAHRHAAKRTLLDLGACDRGSGGTGWWIEVEAEIRFPEDRLAVPDLAGWRVERLSEVPDENPIVIVPDWCCEVLSPSTARNDKHLKLPLYAACAVGWIWLVDPHLRLLEVYETIDARPALTFTAADGQACAPPPFAVPLDLSAWWTTDATT